MLISVNHKTRYVYGDPPAAYAVQRVRLTPLSSPMQTVQAWQLDMPGLAEAASYVDGFGNKTHLVTNRGPLAAIDVAAQGIVETHNVQGVYGEDPGAFSPAVFRRSTPATEADTALSAFAFDLVEPDQLGYLHRLMAAIHRTVAYDTDATHVETSAREAFRQRRGVCQDHAHIFLAAAHLRGIPARYVTGYMCVGDSEAPSLAHHAWAEAYVDSLGWVGFDPANCICPDERYIRLACGFDASATAPITGVRHGGGGERLDVAVVVRQIQQ